MPNLKGFPFNLLIFTLLLFSVASLVACAEKAPEKPAALTVEALKNAAYHSE